MRGQVVIGTKCELREAATMSSRNPSSAQEKVVSYLGNECTAWTEYVGSDVQCLYSNTHDLRCVYVCMNERDWARGEVDENGT